MQSKLLITAAIGLVSGMFGTEARAMTAQPLEAGDLAARVAAVREALATVELPKAAQAKEDEPQRSLVQWFNWPNWQNWNNWRNWGNMWRNF
jgi:hypothetical protein